MVGFSEDDVVLEVRMSNAGRGWDGRTVLHRNSMRVPALAKPPLVAIVHQYCRVWHSSHQFEQSAIIRV